MYNGNIINTQKLEFETLEWTWDVFYWCKPEMIFHDFKTY